MRLLARKVAAEFIGTFMLVFYSVGGPIATQNHTGIVVESSLFVNAACSGITVMIVTLTLGHISGTHLSPAVTVAFAAFRHFPRRHAPAYIAAQFLASICASFALKFLFDSSMSSSVTVPTVGYVMAFALEFNATFVLMFVAAAFATDSLLVGQMACIAVGAAVFINTLLAGPSTGGSMNPARTLGTAIASWTSTDLWIYLTAPFAGALAGAGAYSKIRLPQSEALTN